jgi:hypothetical protein
MSRYHREGEQNCIVGVRGICRYAVMGAKTFYTMHEKHGFPAMRLPDGRWYTTKTLIDEWVRAQIKAQRDAKRVDKEAA